MKKEIKKSLFAFLTLLLTVALCLAIVGCGKTESDQTTPLGTLPPETTNGSDGTTNTGSTSSEPDETTTGTQVDPPVPGQYMNYLTGIPTTKDLSHTKPVAIVVDNILNSYARQTGLGQADVLYEALVAPGITRFLMVVADYTTLDGVCNIRSGRDYHFDLAAYHNALLVCHGGSKTIHYDFYQLAVNRLGDRWGFVDTQQEYWFATSEAGKQYGTIDHYGTRVDLQYDTIFKPAALTALLNSKSAKFVKAGGTIEGTPKQSLKFVTYGTQKSMPGASNATTINLRFTCQGAAGAKVVSYEYNAATGKYMRYQDGTKHIDSVTGQQLSFTNVITLFTDVQNVKSGIATDPNMALVETVGSGIGYYFHGGKVIQITWTSDGSSLKLTEPSGAELTLATGNTYIGYLDNEYIYGGSSFWN